MKTVVAVLHPTDDAQLVTTFKQCGAMLIAGDEQDVLSRFVKAQELTNADYIVRLTSDCPLILDFIISKHINVAVLNDLDYVSNVDEQVRLVFDGMDCEILSKNALKWLDVNAKTKEHREHVTLALRQNHPKEIKFGLFYDWAMEQGFDAVATGHYAQIAKDTAYGEYALGCAKDTWKDQTYFLYRLRGEQLPRFRSRPRLFSPRNIG
jgi:spore coat polysaccharide biosynthesis protein SpsF (cytidylyltransferase family)